MSFSSNVKKELTCVPLGARHCLLAELAAMLLMSGEISDENGQYNIRFQTENAAIARKYFTIVKKAFNINTEVMVKTNKKLHKKQTYLLFIKESEKARKVLQATTILKKEQDSEVIRDYIDLNTIQSICCKRAYLRGAFLGAGSVSDPEKGYHLEFVSRTKRQAEYLKEVMQQLEMEPKIVPRKGNFVVYLKEGTQIVDLLNIIGAHVALMELENVRIVKEVRNNVNRIVNCETANLKKTVSAAVRQMQDIEYIQREVGIKYLPKNLQEVAIYRLEYPSATLKELGELLSPPVGKSGINHRLKKISEIADQLRDTRGGIKNEESNN
ncbi:DNA-binding protein WhiA [Sporanaerobium hydrogeniformans]|uniref:DNA-binding protein WhiA n=1 Tax=Sporanaerobium hydrogeniformans TaxID=3072179 RepID=A0AC61DFE1_9FIRM|nr:DNA-binding protein WhiA [Sporanaerobium hydrogeniformans]PHV71563.1 DNA-binding protein WhiA [Sporanaerobium hydrogeniformans]